MGIKNIFCKYFFKNIFQNIFSNFWKKYLQKIFSIPKCYTILESWDQMLSLGFGRKMILGEKNFNIHWHNHNPFITPLYHNSFNILEPVTFIGEGEYNINNLKEIAVTDSYLGEDEDVIKCQNKESLHNCTTREYRDAVLKECGCLPLNIRLSNEVNFMK